MNHSDIAALMKGAAPAIRDFVASAMQPLVDRIAELERQLEDARSVDHSAAIVSAVDAAFAAYPKPIDGKDADPAEIALAVAEAMSRIPPAERGKDADPEEIRSMVADAVAALPPAAAGKDADKAEVARLIEESVERAAAQIEPREVSPEVVRAVVVEEVAKLPPAEPGKDAEPPTDDALLALIAPLVETAVAGIEKPKDGSSVTVDDLRPMVEELASVAAAEAVKTIPAPKDGEPGADGKLPIVIVYVDGVHYAGDVVTHDGATYQASKDTGREPPHDDWVCLARAGRDGQDGAEGRSFRIRGTYAEGIEDYTALDLVSLNGGAFIAKTNAPGACPGPDWQLVASQGKRGAPGEPGKPGQRGAAAPVVVAMSVDDSGMLMLTNADGSTVECDFYPILSKVR